MKPGYIQGGYIWEVKTVPVQVTNPNAGTLPADPSRYAWVAGEQGGGAGAVIEGLWGTETVAAGQGMGLTLPLTCSPHDLGVLPQSQFTVRFLPARTAVILFTTVCRRPFHVPRGCSVGEEDGVQEPAGVADHHEPPAPRR